jgi:hypothetical protein
MELEKIAFSSANVFSSSLSTKVSMLLMPNINKLIPESSRCVGKGEDGNNGQILDPGSMGFGNEKATEKGVTGAASQTTLWIALVALVLAGAACALVTFSILRQNKMASHKGHLAEPYQLRAVGVN